MKTLFALTYCFEGVDDTLPYASTIAVSEDRTLIEREMKQCVEEDCTEKVDDKWDMSCNYHVVRQVTNEVQLQHNSYNNLYATYKIHKVTVL